jgi:hypothetical protein
MHVLLEHPLEVITLSPGKLPVYIVVWEWAFSLV